MLLLTPNCILIGEFGGDICYIDVKNMRHQEVGKIARNIVKVEHICKLMQKGHVAVAT